MESFLNEQVINSGDKMLNVLEDAIGPTHKLPTEDDDPNNYEVDSSQRKQYDNLFAKMESELYLGCHKFPSLNFLAKWMHLKVLNKWTNKLFNILLKLLKKAFLEGCKLPAFHYATKKLLAKLGLGYE